MRKPLIELRDARLEIATLGGKRALLDSAELQIFGGETVAIMGRSGAGKTSLLSVLGLMQPLSGGSYHLNGVDVTKVKKARAAKLRNTMLGIVFQAGALLGDIDCASNVEVPLLYGKKSKRAVRHQRVQEALTSVGLADVAAVGPNRLSGGEQQRIGIARAIVRDAPIMLADEPTGSLDEITGKTVLDLMIKHATDSDRCLITVTHDPAVAARMSRTLVLRDGKLVAVDPTAVGEVMR